MTQNNEGLLTNEERKELYKRLKYEKEEIIKSIIINRDADETPRKNFLSN